MKIDDAVRGFKCKMIQGALLIHQGNVSATARMLGMERNRLVRWIRELGLQEHCKDLRKTDPVASHSVRVSGPKKETQCA
jgi:DNA-binding NtrC family response regulator